MYVSGYRLEDLDIIIGTSYHKRSACAHYKGSVIYVEHLILYCHNMSRARYIKLRIKGYEISQVKVYVLAGKLNNYSNKVSKGTGI